MRRAAADALARHPRIENVKPLLELWATTAADDTHLVHVARMAVRDQLAAAGVYAALPSVVGEDRAMLDRLAEVSLGVPNAESAEFIWRQLKASPAQVPRGDYLHHVVRYITPERLSEVYAFAVAMTTLNADEQLAIVRELGRGTQESGAKLPSEISEWIARLAGELLAAEQEDRVRGGIELARDFNPSVFDAPGASGGPRGQVRAVAASGDRRLRWQRRAAHDSGAGGDLGRSERIEQAAAACGGGAGANERRRGAGGSCWRTCKRRPSGWRSRSRRSFRMACLGRRDYWRSLKVARRRRDCCKSRR